MRTPENTHDSHGACGGQNPQVADAPIESRIAGFPGQLKGIEISPRQPGRPRTRTGSRAAYSREYQGRWVRERREAWLAEHRPCVACGSWADLEVDHIDPAAKVSHKVWSLSNAKRAEELAKCQVLCRPCHQRKTREDRFPLGPAATFAAIRRVEAGEGVRVVARDLGVAHSTIWRAVKGDHPWREDSPSPPPLIGGAA